MGDKAETWVVRSLSSEFLSLHRPMALVFTLFMLRSICCAPSLIIGKPSVRFLHTKISTPNHASEWVEAIYLMNLCLLSKVHASRDTIQ